MTTVWGVMHACMPLSPLAVPLQMIHLYTVLLKSNEIIQMNCYLFTEQSGDFKADEMLSVQCEAHCTKS